MKYKIKFYSSGKLLISTTMEAPNPDLAAKRVTKPYEWQHLTLAGKKIIRYNKNLERVTGEPIFFKVDMDGKHPSVLAMIDNLAEFYCFGSSEKRDEALRIISTSAEFAKTQGARTDTTAYSGETSGSRSGSMSPKISSGSATNATWLDVLTRYGTDRTSGTPKSGGLDTQKWSSGSKDSLSKQNRISTYATIKPEIETNPMATPNMKKMAGKTVLARPNGKLFLAGDYVWAEEWLDFDHATLEVKRKALRYGRKISKYIGKILFFTKCKCGCNSWKHGRYYLDEKFLRLPTLEEKTVASMPFKAYEVSYRFPNKTNQEVTWQVMYGKAPKEGLQASWAAAGFPSLDGNEARRRTSRIPF